MLSPFIDSSVNSVLLQTSTSRFSSLSKFLNGVCLTCCGIVNTVSERTGVRAVGSHRSREIKFIDVFLFISAHISLVLFVQVVQKQTLGEVGTLIGSDRRLSIDARGIWMCTLDREL